MRQTFSCPKNYLLNSDSEEEEKQSNQMDFIDKNLELEIGWALNPIRRSNKPVSLSRKSGKSLSNSLVHLSRVSYATFHKKSNKSLQEGISPYVHRTPQNATSLSSKVGNSRKATYDVLPTF